MNTSTLRVAALTVALLLAACGSSSKSNNNNDNNQNPPPTATSTIRTWVVPDRSSLPAERVPAFGTGGLYVNAHSQAHGNGEIRGQLDVEATTVRFATLTGAQETPAVSTNAFGAGVLSMTSDGKIRGFVVTSGITGTLAHIHLAARSSPGDILVGLTGGPEVWVVPDDTTLTQAGRDAFDAGNLYFNVHSAAHGTGEIRGQLDRAGTPRVTSLDGAQETPPVTTTTAYGGGVFAFDGDKPAGFLVASGITGTLAHLHEAARTSPGDIRVGLTGGPTLWVVPDQPSPVAATVVTAFQNGQLYANVHSAEHGSGEIRGQLDETGDARIADLFGDQETPPVSTTAHGGAVITVDSGSGATRGFLVTEGIANPTVAHIHPGTRGNAGTPVLGLSP